MTAPTLASHPLFQPRTHQTAMAIIQTRPHQVLAIAKNPRIAGTGATNALVGSSMRGSLTHNHIIWGHQGLLNTTDLKCPNTHIVERTVKLGHDLLFWHLTLFRLLGQSL